MLGSNDLSLGFSRVLGSFRETIAIILRQLLFNNGWGQLKKKEKEKIMQQCLWYDASWVSWV